VEFIIRKPYVVLDDVIEILPGTRNGGNDVTIFINIERTERQKYGSWTSSL
jgi:hypothetical protein